MARGQLVLWHQQNIRNGHHTAVIEENGVVKTVFTCVDLQIGLVYDIMFAAYESFMSFEFCRYTSQRDTAKVTDTRCDRLSDRGPVRALAPLGFGHAREPAIKVFNLSVQDRSQVMPLVVSGRNAAPIARAVGGMTFCADGTNCVEGV